MARWPLRTHYTRQVRRNRTTSAPDVITCVASATPHTAGAWVQVEASLAYDVHQVHILASTNTFSNSVNTSTLLDIGIGAAASEIVVVDSLQCGFRDAGGFGITLPLFIPAGTRVAMRIRSLVVSKSISFYVDMDGGQLWDGLKGFQRCISYGHDTANSRGTLVARSTANTKGAWVALSTSTTRRIRHLMLTYGGSGTSMATTQHIFDIGIGGAGSEVIVIADMYVSTTNTEIIVGDFPPQHVLRLEVPIPEGSRLSVRHASDGATAASDMYVAAHAFD